MTISIAPLRSLSLLTLAILACTFSASAAPANASTEAQTRYRQDMAVCNSGQSNQDRATCRREAGSALAEARRGALNDAPGQYQLNALQRCSVHKGAERSACEARMSATGSVEGSVEAGGILRQSVTITPAQ
ncbi:hypothetical protein [Rhodoferax sp.]|uniref:hypothetical protein n=1 Tax=Rhodoferax sp. TaxID=50421 RepID=UPI0026247C76|nr:hypothetical protein [Rhodoferax sp.]MDD2918580.1 hypothetical protein [Rhodoferax sp.]